MGNELTGDNWHIPLPSGAWVEVRSIMNPKDQRAVQGAVGVEIHNDGQGASVARLPGDHQAARRAALLYRIITNWSWAEQGIPIPSQNIAGADVIEEGTFTLKDLNELDEKIAPLMEEVNPSRRPNSTRPSQS